MAQPANPSKGESLLQKQYISRDDFFNLKGPIICTHDGRFHLDEILGCAMLLSLPQFAGGRILRSRNTDDHEKADVVIDVGGQYDSGKNRFDHHQRGFDVKFDFARFEGKQGENKTENKCIRQPVTKLSSAGLVFSHYGEQLFRERYGIEDPAMVRAMMREVYVQFIEAVDAIDNGVTVCKDGPPVYEDRTCLSSQIAALYPSNLDDDEEKARKIGEWEFLVAESEAACRIAYAERFAAAKEGHGKGFFPTFDWRSVPISGGTAEEVWAFRKGMKLADKAFSTRVALLRDTWLPGLPVLHKALLDGLAGDLAHAAVELPRWTPIEGHIYSLERELGLKPLSFHVYPSEKQRPDGSKFTTWTIRCVAVEGQQFVNRLSLHEAWRGLRDEALGEAVIKGMPMERQQELQLKPADFVFCHATGFLGIANSRSAAYEMIRQTLEAQSAKDN